MKSAHSLLTRYTRASEYGARVRGPVSGVHVDGRLVEQLRQEGKNGTYKVHVVFDEGKPYQHVMNALESCLDLRRWQGQGWTGETFALQGEVSAPGLSLISSFVHAGVKFVWLLVD
jgi:hypothetical protein